MTSYKSIYTGSQVDEAVGKVLNDNATVKYGNIIGDIEDQPDLVGALNAIRSIRLELTVEDEEQVLKLGDEIQSFEDVVNLIFNEPRLVYVKAPDCLLFPGIFDLEGSPAYIYFVGVNAIGSPGVKYLRMEDDDSITLQQVYNEVLSNRVTEISIQSTDSEYPTAKAVYNAIDTVLGSINEALDEIIGEPTSTPESQGDEPGGDEPGGDEPGENEPEELNPGELMG